MPKNKRTNRKKRNNRRPRMAPPREQQLNSLSSAKHINLGMNSSPYPIRQTVLCSASPALELFSGVNAFSVIEYKVNDVRDPFGSGLAAVGYTFYSQIYRIFRVQRIKISFEATNTETVTPINIYMHFSDTQPSTYITTWASAVTYSSASLSTRPILLPGNTANSKIKQRMVNIPMGDILGNSLNYHAANAYAGSDSSSPTQVLWCAFVAYSGDAASTFADGLEVTARIVWNTDFYSLRPIA